MVQPEVEPVRWGFLGAGGIARTALGPAVHDARNAVLHTAAARDPQRAAALGLAVEPYGAYPDLLADTSVEVVYVALNNDAHLPWTLAALEAGKHVLCEKPLGLDAAEAERVRDAAAASGRLAVEAVWSRWHPRTRAAEALLAAGGLGAVRRASASFVFDDSEGRLDGNYRLDPALGGGALYDVGCYALSAVLWAFGGGSVREVLDARADRSASGVDLTTVARLGVGDGEAEIRCGMAGPEEQRFSVECEHGTLTFDGDAFSTREPCAFVVRTADGEHRQEFPAVNPYQLMVEAFSTAVRGGEAWLLPLEESVRVARGLDLVRAALG